MQFIDRGLFKISSALDIPDWLSYRVKDWLFGVRAAQPDQDTSDALSRQSLTEAERYRMIHHLITSPPEEGGAGVVPKDGQWKYVESIFPLHDKAFNKEWMKRWSTMTFLKPEDLDSIRDRLGEKVSLDLCVPQPLENFVDLFIDCLLLCVHTIVFCFFDISCCIWIFLMGSTRALLLCVRYCQWSVECDICRVLETPRDRPCCSLGCQWCI